MYFLIYVMLSLFLYFCAGNVASPKEINVLDSSSEPVDLDIENCQICEISTELSDDARQSQCFNQVTLLAVSYNFYQHCAVHFINLI